MLQHNFHNIFFHLLKGKMIITVTIFNIIVEHWMHVVSNQLHNFYCIVIYMCMGS